MAKVPGGKPPEKTDRMLPAAAGIGSNDPDACKVQAEPLRGPVFLEDHQLAVDGETYLPGEDPDTLAKLRKAGFVIEVKGGGLSGHLKDR